MADDNHYDSHKRKYDDADSLPPPPRRRATGFSDGPPPYATVPPPQAPPPIDDFAAIKQNFQQLASRALSNSNLSAKGSGNGNGNGDDVNKRSKFDDAVPAYSSGYGSYSDQKPHSTGSQYGNTPSAPASYGYSGSGNKKIEIPNGRVGVIIGKAGETIKYLQNNSGARIQITRDTEHDPNTPNRVVELMGTPDQIAKAEQMIRDVIAEADTGGPGSARNMPLAPGSEQFVMKVASSKVGLVIGKAGETIKNIQASSGAKVQVIPLRPPPGDMSMERTVQIDGTSEQIEIAKQMVYDVTEEDVGQLLEYSIPPQTSTNRNRNPPAGGYSQQGYQARPQTNWAPQPPQAQQPGGYGYMQQQQGTYPGAQSQYTQQPYSGYPPQPASGTYPQTWDPSAAPQTQQAPGSGYDYYGQQQSTGAPTDNSGYNYSQPPTTGAYTQQGYSQEGYAGGYQAPTAQSGYDSQSGYGSTPGYGNATNTQSQDGNASSYTTSQGETTPAQPAAQAQQGYMSQPGYGMPPASQPGYGAASTAQPGYGQPQGQRTPPPSQAGYAQPGAYGGPTAQPGAYGGPTAQPGSYPPPYGAPPVTPPSYGQQPPSYYGGGYSQPPAYPTDGGNGSAAVATPSPASQPPAQPTSAAKRSP